MARSIFWLACVALCCLSACGGEIPSASSNDRLRIVTTTAMLGDMARAVAGDQAEVLSLMGEGVDPHLFKPTRTDIQAVVSADVIVVNGLFLEGRMEDAFERAQAAGRNVFAVGEAIPHDELLHPHGAAAHADPHIWMDPLLWSRCGAALAERLATIDPGGAEAYRANGERFSRDALSLHEAASAAIATIPAEHRILITAHDAFGYFGRRYGLEVHGIQGISTESEAGLADLESLVTLVVDRGVPAVFVESTVSPRTIQALVAGVEARGHRVAVGGQLFSDSMGKPGTPEGTWPGMIQHNVRTIVEALTSHVRATPTGGPPDSAAQGRPGGAP